MSVDMRRAKEVFLATCEEPHEERGMLLQEMCGEEDELRAEVEELLRFHDGDEQDLLGIGRAESLALLRDSLDRYAVEREIGSGGMATVYLAEDLKHRRRVALKVLNRKLAESVGADRFLREIETTAHLQHPHIVPLLDSGQVNGLLFFVTPYEAGGSLRDRLRREGRLPVDDAVRVLRDVVDALDYAHRHDVLHRDIKPGNVLLSDRHALLADFGIARALVPIPRADRVTKDGTMLGTPAYMAPEQAAGDPALDHRADIYAVGAVGYEMLTGRPPFVEPSAAMVLAAKLNKVPESPRNRRDEVPPGVEAIVMRCLERDPAARWPGAGELLQQVEGWMARRSRVEPDGSWPTRPPGRRKRRRMAWWAAAAVVLAAGIGQALALRGTGAPGPTEPRILIVPLENRTGDPILDELAERAADHVAEAVRQVEFLELVPNAVVRQHVREAREAGSGDVLREAAVRTEADFMVSGAIFFAEGGRQLRLGIIDASTWVELQHVSGSWPVGGVPAALREVGERVAGALAVHLGPGMGGGHALPVAPRLQAYRLHRQGYEASDRREHEKSLDLQLAAYAEDTTFVQSIVSAGWAAVLGGRRELADSLARFADARRHLLGTGGVLDLDALFAQLVDDHRASLVVGRAAARLYPGTYAELALAHVALRMNRLSEAREALDRYDPAQDGLSEPPIFYWNVLNRLRHALGHHWREWRAARRAREAYPLEAALLDHEMHALAALGRSAEALALLEQAAMLSSEPWWGAAGLGAELRAHGHPEAARRAFERGLEWLSAAEPDEPDRAEHASWVGGMLYGLERWEEAREAFLTLPTGFPDELWSSARMGLLAARMGDTATAERVDAELAGMRFERRRQDFHRLMHRARIAALLGRPDEAMRLLGEMTQSFRVIYPKETHRDMDLESLRGRADYQSLMAPRG